MLVLFGDRESDAGTGALTGECDGRRLSGSAGGLGDDPLLLIPGLGRGLAAGPHSRSAARMQISRSGQVDAMASCTRRTLMMTRAPILRSFNLMVPQVALRI